MAAIDRSVIYKSVPVVWTSKYTASSLDRFCCCADVCRSIGVLCTAIGNSTLSVRVSAASAAANVADALQRQQQQLDPQMTAPLLELAKGNFRSVRISLRVPYLSDSKRPENLYQASVLQGDILQHTERWHELRGAHIFCPSGFQPQGS